MYQKELKVQISPSVLGLVATALISLVFLAIAPYINLDSFKIITKNDEETFEVDLELSAQMMAQKQDQNQINMDASYLEKNPDLIVMKIRSEKYIANSSFEDFLSKISSKQVFEQKVEKVNSKNTLVIAKSNTNNTVNYQALLSNKDYDDETLDTSALKGFIAKNQEVFQACYEKTLIKDQLLSGNASILLNIGKSAKVNFKGIGQAQYKKELEDCLSQKAVRINFPSQFRGNKVKFNLFFSS